MADKYAVGDRVRVKTSGGIAVIEKGTAKLWAELMNSSRYSVRYEEGQEDSGRYTHNIDEENLEPVS